MKNYGLPTFNDKPSNNGLFCYVDHQNKAFPSTCGLSGWRMGGRWLPVDVGQCFNPGVAEALGWHHLSRSCASLEAM